MKMGRRRSAVLAGATAVVAAILGLGGVEAAAGPVATPMPEACNTTNGEYRVAQPGQSVPLPGQLVPLPGQPVNCTGIPSGTGIVIPGADGGTIEIAPPDPTA
jgi:hypothetical protein